MDFSVQLSAYYPDHDYGGDRLYRDMLEQAVLADRLGFEAVSITEHHLINILLMPAPLQFAVKIASITQRVKILTCVVVLPIHDMRVFAGEIVCADIFCEGRAWFGVGRGAFGFEMDRLGVPLETSREKFDESLAVLIALLTEEDVSWDGKYYRFEPLTITPRPMTRPMPRLMIAAVTPEAVYHCARRGFHVQTTPLAGNHQYMLDQIDAFKRGREEADPTGVDLTLSMSRVAYLAKNEADRRAKLALDNHYYSQFDNVFTGPGLVDNGIIRPLPRKQTLAELERNLHIGTSQQLIDQLAPYAEAGVDRFILNINFGAEQAETLDSIRQFAEEVMPHFTARRVAAPAAEVAS